MSEGTLVSIQWASMIALQAFNIALYMRGSYRSADVALSFAHIIALLRITALTN